MPNPFDLFSSWVNSLLSWFANQWMVSGGQALMNSIQQLTAAQFPKIGQHSWYLDLWNSVFGLSLVIGLGAVFLHSVIFMFKENYPSVGASIVGFFRLTLNGLFLLVFVVMAMAAADFVVQLMAKWTKDILGTYTWTNAYTTTMDLSHVDIWLRLGLSFTSMEVGNFLYLNTLIMNAWILLYVLWYLFSGAFGVSKIAQFIRSVIMALLLASMFSRVIQVFHLGLSAVILNFASMLGLPDLGALLVILFVALVALLIPMGMVIAFTIAFYKRERRLDVRAFIERQRNNTSTSMNPDNLVQEKVSTVTRIKEGTKDAASGIVRWASIAAATAAFAKMGTAVAAKFSAAAPTPQTKTAALALTAATTGLNWLEGKTRDFIHKKTSRPGANRAQSRMSVY